MLLCLPLAILTAPAQPVQLTLGQNFVASTYALNSTALPPDSNGTIGPQHFVEFINGSVSIYNRTNGVLMSRKTNLQFWAAAGLILSSDSATSDPRVIYDSTTQRWFASQVDINATATDPTVYGNDFLLAVSATSDPRGPWHGVMFPADPDTSSFADFPTLGLDANAVYLSGDMYIGQTNPVGASLVSIPKADLTNSTPTAANRTWFGVMNYTNHGEVLQPAICFDGSVTGAVLGLGDIGYDSDPHSNVVFSVVQNGGTPTASLSAATSINVSPYVVPMNDNLGAPNFNPTQPDGTTNIMGDDGRLSARVYAVGGVLYAVHNTEVNNRIAIQWFRINAATHALLESGTIADNNLDLFYPCIAANSNGVVVIACNGSSINTFVSCYALAGVTINGVTQFGGLQLLQAGQVSYHGDDETYADLMGLPLSSRWGDYNSISVDPNDANRFWTIVMYPSDAANADVWSTQVTELVTTYRPALALSVTGNQAVVAWPGSATGYGLQATTNLANASAWLTVTNLPVLTNNNFTVTLPLTNAAARFFRLKK